MAMGVAFNIQHIHDIQHPDNNNGIVLSIELTLLIFDLAIT